MSRRRKKLSAPARKVLCLAVLAAVLGTGYLWGAKRASRTPLVPPGGPARVRLLLPGRRAGAKEISGKIYFLAIINQQERLTPLAYPLPAARPAEEALAILLHTPPPAGYQSPLPAGVALRKVTVKDGLATADFSRELVDNFSGGSDNEGAAVFAIVDTLCALPGVKQVQIRVEGKRIDSIGGHLDISSPLSYDGELVVAGR
jgi:hypothetical protein